MADTSSALMFAPAMRPLTESFAYGVVVAIPKNPFVLIVSADIVEVAKVAGLEVARYKKPPAFLKVQWLEEPEPSERAN